MTSTLRTGFVRRTCSALLALALSALTLLIFIPSAAAGDELTTTPPAATVVPPNASTPLPGASIATADPDARLQVTVSTDRGTLGIGTTDGLDLAYGNDWTGSSSITFTGALNDLNAALATLAITTGNDAGTTAEVTVSALVDVPGVVYAPTNQHFFEYVPAPGISNDDARAAALQRSFLGQQGYLANIASAELNELVSTRIEGAASVWFGARSIDDYPYRNWVWGDGPLANQTISLCQNFEGPCQNIADPGIYSSWSADEPNNAGGETVAVTNWSGGRGNWNDLAPYNNGASGYVIEYGDQIVGGSTLDNVIATSTSSVDIRGVPGRPTNVSADRGDTKATVTFEPPVSDGGSAITGYEVTATPGDSVTECAASTVKV